MTFPINPNPGDTYTDTYGTVWVYAGSVNGWYRKEVIPGNETTYTGGGSGSATATGNAGEIQYTDGTNLAASPNLLWDNANDELEIGGDIILDDGGTYNTTLQTVTPTANRTISLPDATGTVALVAGSSGQLTWNNAGAYAGVTGSTADTNGNITLSTRLINSANGSAFDATSTTTQNNTGSPLRATGTWFTGGTSTTTKPQVLIEPTGATSTAWSTSGTGLGVNAASGFAGNLLDLQVNGTSQARVTSFGSLTLRGGIASDSGININISPHGSSRAQFNNTSLLFRGDGNLSYFGWATSGAFDTLKTVVWDEGSGIWAQRNGTSAQTFRLYNTYTDASNYERGFFRWSSNVLEVGPEAAGTGTTRPMRITAATLKLPNLPTYADNAAATTGGLVAGDVYKTATGELRITV